MHRQSYMRMYKRLRIIVQKYEDNYVVIIDNFDDDENEIFVRGWYSTGKPKCDNDSDVYVWLRDEQNHYVRALALKEMREDVANNLNDGTCYVGFSCYLPKEEFFDRLG